MRGAPACVVMRPNVPALKLLAGFPQLKVLSKLNVSNRSSTRCVPTSMSFESAMSTCQNDGPTARFRLASPSSPRGASAKAARLK